MQYVKNDKNELMMVEISEEVILATQKGQIEDKQYLVNAIKCISEASDQPEFIEFWIQNLLSFQSKEARSMAFSILLNWIKNKWEFFPENMLQPLLEVVFIKFYTHPDYSDLSFKHALSKLQAFILFRNTTIFTTYIELLPSIDFSSFYLMILNFTTLLEDNFLNEEEKVVVLNDMLEKGYQQQLLEFSYTKYIESLENSKQCFELLFKWCSPSLLLNESLIQTLNFILTNDFKTGISILVNISTREIPSLQLSEEEKKQIVLTFPILSMELDLTSLDIQTLKNIAIYIRSYLTPIIDFDLSTSFYSLAVTLLDTRNLSIVDDLMTYFYHILIANSESSSQIQELCMTKVVELLAHSQDEYPITDLDLLIEKYLNMICQITKISKESFLELIKTLLEGINENTPIGECAVILSSFEQFASNESAPQDFIPFIQEKFLPLLTNESPYDFSYIMSLASYCTIIQKYYDEFGHDFITAVFIQCSNVVLSVFSTESETRFTDTLSLDKLCEQIQYIAKKYYKLFIENSEIIEFITNFIMTKKKSLIYSLCKIINNIEISAKQEIFASCLDLFINDSEFNADIENTLDFINDIDLSECNDLKSSLVDYFSTIQAQIFSDGEEEEESNIPIIPLFVSAIFNSLGIDAFPIIFPNLENISDEMALSTVITQTNKYITQLAEQDAESLASMLTLFREKTLNHISSPRRPDEQIDEEEENDHLVSVSVSLQIAAFPLIQNSDFQKEVIVYVIAAMNSLRIKEKKKFQDCVQFINSVISTETFEIIEGISFLFQKIISDANQTNINRINKMQFLESLKIIQKISQINFEESQTFMNAILENVGSSEELGHSFFNLVFGEEDPKSFFQMLK